MHNWITVIAALAGAVIGGFISFSATLVTLASQQRSEKRSIFLSKLEETHQVARTIRQMYKEAFGAMKGYLEMGMELSQNSFSAHLEIDRLVMLVSCYCPDLNKIIQSLESSRKEFGDALTEGMGIVIGPNRSKDETLYSLEKKYKELDDIFIKLLESITLIARKQLKF